MTAKKALVTGITGQDGSYLAELLLEKGYEVHGLVRRSSSFNTWRIDHIRDGLVLHYGDLVDQNSLARALEALRPDEVYNLAAQSHVRVSFDMPEYTTDVTAIGVLRVLDLGCGRGESLQVFGERLARTVQHHAPGGFQESQVVFIHQSGMQGEDATAGVDPPFTACDLEQIVDLQAQILIVAGTEPVQQHQVYHEVAPAPISMRLEQLLNDAKFLFAVDLSQQDRVIS